MKNTARNRLLIGAIALIACAWLSWSRDRQPCGTCIAVPGGFCETKIVR